MTAEQLGLNRRADRLADSAPVSTLLRASISRVPL
jgi:hypothetical protein